MLLYKFKYKFIQVYHSDTCRNVHFFQGCTEMKGPQPDLGQAAVEGTRADAHHPTELQRNEGSAMSESISPNAFDAVRQRHSRQGIAPSKGCSLNASHRVGRFDVQQVFFGDASVCLTRALQRVDQRQPFLRQRCGMIYQLVARREDSHPCHVTEHAVCVRNVLAQLKLEIPDSARLWQCQRANDTTHLRHVQQHRHGQGEPPRLLRDVVSGGERGSVRRELTLPLLSS